MTETARVVVAGSGIVGASAAYELARREAGVIVVLGEVAGPATAAGAGIICPWTGRGDGPGVRLGAAGARHYPELIAMLAEDGETGTGYARVGALCIAAAAGSGGPALAEVAQVLRSRRDDYPEIGEVELLGPGMPAGLFPPLEATLSAVWVSGAARIDGRAIRDSLLRAAARRGARLVSGTAVLAGQRERVTGVRVRRPGGGQEAAIGADAVLVAAGAWTGQVCAGFGPALPIGPQRGQIVHLDLPGADTSGWPAVLPGRDPYLLAFPPCRVVAGATREDAGFDCRTTAGGLSGILSATLAVAPGLADASVAGTRVGFRPATPDGLPLVGWVADGLLVAAGHGPEGLTAGPWTGAAAAALALGEPPPADLSPFDPARSPGRSR
jgi:D-amino-acid dehydrogenase